MTPSATRQPSGRVACSAAIVARRLVRQCSRWALRCCWSGSGGGLGSGWVPAPAVVVAAAELAVVGGGGPAGGPGLDVVALAAASDGQVAAVVGAALVADLEGSAGGAGEAAGPTQVDDPGGPVEHDPFDQRLVQQCWPRSRG